MPDSEERPIERLLRSAAQKRREEAGSPEMHPATRETLLTEVRRQYGSGRQAAARPWWRRLAPALAALAVVATGTWLVLRNDSPTRLELARFEPQDENRQAGAPVVPGKDAERGDLAAGVTLEVAQQNRDAQVAVSALEPPLNESSFASSSTQSNVQFIRYEEFDLLKARSAPASVPASAEAASLLDQNKTSGAVANGRTDTSILPLAQAPTRTSTAPAMALNAMEAEVAATPNANSLGFAAAATGQSDEARPRAKAAVVPVLQQFVVTHRGNQVRFVDADGSTYEGDWTPVAPMQQETTAPAGSRGVDSVSGPAVAARRPASEPQVVSYTFDAAGTNRSLQQSVRFQGQIVLTREQAELARNGFFNTLSPDQQRAADRLSLQTAPLPAGRVVGTLQLGDGSTLQVDAAPTTP